MTTQTWSLSKLFPLSSHFKTFQLEVALRMRYLSKQNGQIFHDSLLEYPQTQPLVAEREKDGLDKRE